MSNGFLVSWFIVMFPLVISPGPANIVFAASGVRFGVRKSLPLLIGVDLVLILKSLLIGFGLASVLQDNPMILNILQLVGSLYLFFLAYKFFKVSLEKENTNEKKLGFLDGMLIQIFNIKGWILITLMFSLFMNDSIIENQTSMILLLVFMLFLLNVTAHLIWISFSSYIISVFLKNRKIQNIVFSLSLFLVGFWFIIENEIVRSLV